MSYKRKIRRNLYDISLFFILVAFIATCIIYSFAAGLDIDIRVGNVNALYTFLNVVVLSILLWLSDSVRRKLTIDRHTRKIIKGLSKIMNGDFDIEIEKINTLYAENQFNEIIDGINIMARELRSVETLRTDFVSNVSHELKTPLAIIQNYGTLLQDTTLTNEERKEYVKKINDTSKEFAKLITNILSLNKLENQQKVPNTKKFNLGNQLTDSILFFEDEINNKELIIDADIEENINVKSDEELLRIVWNNLISNAIKFSNKGGTLSVKASSTDDLVTVLIKDTGIGMNEETGKRIFDKFYQGSKDHSTSGNGLGLSLVKRIITILNSEINVSSKLGKGSTFTVKIKKIK